MQPSVLVELTDRPGRFVCYAGNLIGRSAIARLRLQRPDISEAHAMISLRGGALWLLYLRRPASIDGRPVWELPLEAGVVAPLADGVALKVCGIWGAGEVLALQLGEHPPLALSGGHQSLGADGVLVDGRLAGALAEVWWTDGEPWILVLGEAGAEPALPERSWTTGGQELKVVLAPSAGTAWTQRVAVRPSTTVRTSARLTRVEDELGASCELKGNSSLVCYSLAIRTRDQGKGVAWTAVGSALWGAKRAPFMWENMRNNVLYRLDQRLRAFGLRDDLIRREGGLMWFADGVRVEVEEDQVLDTSGE